jgi:hypothetical protein
MVSCLLCWEPIQKVIIYNNREAIDNVKKKGSRRLMTNFVVVLRVPITLTGGSYSEYF